MLGVLGVLAGVVEAAATVTLVTQYRLGKSLSAGPSVVVLQPPGGQQMEMEWEAEAGKP